MSASSMQMMRPPPLTLMQRSKSLTKQKRQKAKDKAKKAERPKKGIKDFFLPTIVWPTSITCPMKVYIQPLKEW